MRASSGQFVLRAAPGAGSAARLGLVAGRKAAKRAVDRNRAKRLIRSFFSEVRGQLPPWDIVLQLRSDLRAVGNREVRAELAKLFGAVKSHARANASAGVDRT
jgi:ribonuclease P protein component